MRTTGILRPDEAHSSTYSKGHMLVLKHVLYVLYDLLKKTPTCFSTLQIEENTHHIYLILSSIFTRVHIKLGGSGYSSKFRRVNLFLRSICIVFTRNVW